MEVVIGILGGVVTAIGGILVAWVKYRQSMADIEGKVSRQAAQTRFDSHEQVVASFKVLIDANAQHADRQRQDFLAAIDFRTQQAERQRTDFLTADAQRQLTFAQALKDEREFHHQAIERVVGSLSEMVERSGETSQQLEQLTRHLLANQEHITVIRDFILRQGAAK